jgi:hypothetical protein
MASRLAFFLWGRGPDETVLNAAAQGDKLQTPGSVKQLAQYMMDDEKGRQGINRFHSLWLGYGYENSAPPPTLAKPLLRESEALIERIIKEQRSWLNLFQEKETFLDKTLAKHYGLPDPSGDAGWVPYGSTGRQGILSHGAFLGVEAKTDWTSPTLRGHYIRVRLMCQEVPAPPDDVDIDNRPTEGTCKAGKYAMWKQGGKCQGCHVMMDPIGHGLENYDLVGRYRTIGEEDKAGCEITGDGEIVGRDEIPNGKFQGVAGLSDRLVTSGVIGKCVTTQMANYYLGREVRRPETCALDSVAKRFHEGGQRFDQMMLDLVGLESFGYRVADPQMVAAK